MKRNELVGLVVAALGAAAGCGDNSDTCGPGTTAVNGVCTPSTTPPTCTDGTILNAQTNSCEIDPNSCQDGTVLINNKCQDPTAGLTIDLEEGVGSEPNGLGIGEASSSPAGVITALKPVGQAFVIHGHITPFQDADGDGITDPDFDTYTLTITAPTYLEVSADGVHGLAAAFIVSGDAGGNLPTYRRFGMNLTGDTSKRKIYLPAAGTYDFTIGDTRSMFLDANSPPAAGAGGASGDANTEYFVSISQLDIPTPTALTVTGGVATDSGTGATGFGLDDLKFYTVPMGVGFNDIQLAMPQSSANASVVVVNNAVFKAVADEAIDPNTGLPAPADTTVAGVNPTDTTLIIGDYNWNYGPEAADYTLTVTQGQATPLKTDGTSTAAIPEISALPQGFAEFNIFYYDVAADNEIDGMNLTWSHPIDGVLVTSGIQILSDFSFDPFNGFVGNTWVTYNGLLRHATAGRYYFVVYDPAFTAGGTIAATSTITALTPTAIALGTQTASQTNNLFNSTPFTYDAGTTVPWQQYLANGTGTGVVTAAFLDPSTSFGRLDNVVLDTTAEGGGPGSPGFDDLAPVFTQALAATGTAKGRIVLDDPITSYLVKVNTATATTTSTYKLTFESRVSPVAGTAFGDFGTITATATTLSPNTLAAGDKNFFFLKTTPGGLAQLVATPTGTVKPDVVLTSLNADETVDTTIQTVGTGAETGTFAAHSTGWVAVQVTGVAAGTTGTFDISAQTVTAPTYTNSTPTVPFVTICNAGHTTDVTMHADSTIFGSPTDEGLSDRLAVPNGFKFFGASVGGLQISTNGWLSFQTNHTDAVFSNVTMPSATDPNALIAPFWTDLANVQICAKTIGSVMTIEWQAIQLVSSEVVATQVQLNATTGAITFVYDTTQTDTGVDATVGIEDFSGAAADLIGFNTAATITAGGAKRLTPN